MQNNSYESFRNILTANLIGILSPDQINEVLSAVDLSASDFEMSEKQMELTVTTGIPEVVKLYLGTRIVANLSKGTIEQYKAKLLHFFSAVNKPYCDITPNDIRMYLYYYKMEHHASDNYLDNIRRTLNCFFQWLVVNEYGITRNPCGKVEKIRYQEKKREPLTSYELEYFRSKIENIREKALIDFFFSTGMRLSEVAETKLSDINWDARSVHVRHGKGNKERYVFFNAECEVSLRAYLSSRKDDSEGLFVSRKAPYCPLKNRALENIIRKVSARSGIKVFPHRLRHTFATAGLQSGMPLPMLQELLGHAKPETTMIYAKEDQTFIQMEHRKAYA